MTAKAVKKYGLWLAAFLFLAIGAVELIAGGRSLPGRRVVTMWGQQGSGPGEFQGPFDLTVDTDGFVYVTDSGNQRVQKFTPGGQFVLQWGRLGRRPGEFQKPTGIAMAEHAVYVSDFIADTVQRFTPDGRLLTRWGQSGRKPGQLDSPADVAVGADGSIYVADEYNFRIQRFTPEGRLLTVWGQKGKVHSVLSALNFLLPEDLDGSFYYPARLTVGGDALVYVADSYNNRIQVFTADGHFVRKWGGMGFRGGRFRVASGLDFDRAGRLYIADFYNNRVQVFAANGAYLGQVESAESQLKLNGPTAVAVSPNGDLYVADFHHHRIMRFRELGS